jgi:hypothetical protein
MQPLARMNHIQGDSIMALRSFRTHWKGEDGAVWSEGGSMNGKITDSEILAYYVGNTFNVGKGEHDYMAVCTAVDILDKPITEGA